MDTHEVDFGGIPPRVSIAMLGPRMHFAVPIILAGAGFLDTFFTDVHLGNKAWLYRLVESLPKNGGPSVIRQLSGRVALGVPTERIVSFDGFGLWYVLKRRRRMGFREQTELYAKMNQRFGERVVRRGLGSSNAVWGFNGASLEIFKHAKEKGITCILEQAIAPRKIERELLNEEVARWPEWQSGLRCDLRAGLDPLAEREEAEWELADKIVCGSAFVLDGLRGRGVSSSKCCVVPYGVEATSSRPADGLTPRSKVNVLFVGEIGLRKGVPYLLEALRAIDAPERVHAKLVGPLAITHACLAKYERWCDVVGPVPRTLMSALYDWADLLVLPSICEGSATVTYEALVRGLPIITTPNSGSLVRDGIEGFIVPVRDQRAIQEKIELFCDDSALRSRLISGAKRRAEEASMEAYAKRLLEVISIGRN